MEGLEGSGSGREWAGREPRHMALESSGEELLPLDHGGDTSPRVRDPSHENCPLNEMEPQCSSTHWGP